MIAFREGHQLAAKKSVSLAEVAEYPWAFFNRYIHPYLHDLILQRVDAKHKQVSIVHQASQPDQVPALLTNDSLVAWVNPAGVECIAKRGFAYVPLIDEDIRLETHVACLAGNTSQMVSEFVRKFVKLTELRRPPEQLPLPIV
jgi:DNA-binding transcriptional LysR family regulator